MKSLGNWGLTLSIIEEENGQVHVASANYNHPLVNRPFHQHPKQ